jgi:predicted kinase
MEKPYKNKLIILYGFAASGKTTISKMYIEKYPLAMNLETDRLIDMIGNWETKVVKSRKLVFEHLKLIAKNHLYMGHDVILPYLLINPEEIQEFKKIADEQNISFYEFYLYLNKEESIQRLLKRGCWGEENSPKLTRKDIPEISEFYDSMEKAMNSRKDVIKINPIEGEIKQTFLDIVKNL